MKTKMYECPNCHEVEEVVIHLNECLDIGETENGDHYEFATFHCRCYRCGQIWKEDRLFVYDGHYDPDTQRTFAPDGSEVTN